MKIKFKLIATAAVLALASSMAAAAINTSSSPDLLFVAYAPILDGSGGSTYVRDLGSISSLASSTNFAAPTASIFASQFAGVDPTAIQWNVIAFDGTSPAVYLTGDSTVLVGLKGSYVQQIVGSETASLGGLTQLDLAANGYAKANGEYTGSTTLNNQTNGLTLTTYASFGNQNLVSGQGVGSSQNFIKVSRLLYNSPTVTVTQLYLNSSLSAFDENANGGYFTLADAQGDLSWTNAAAVAAVPLPAAVLVFFPGLLAMFGLGRRRQNTVA